MLPRIWLRLAEIVVPVILAIMIFVAWEADRRDRAQLAIQLAAAQQTISEAATRQHDRDAVLNQTLAQLAAQKQSVLTPEQILKNLPNVITLPEPITLQHAAPPRGTSSSLANPMAVHAGVSSESTAPVARGTQAIGNRAAPDVGPPNPASKTDPPGGNTAPAVIPAADLKPLYDFALDCKACQARLAASQSDLSDEKSKTTAMIKERDAAVRAAKGGSVLRRIKRAAKWFAIGAAAGAIAAKAAH